ncbi:MAG: amidohydrolase family protein [Lewinellaceae bacterium]|nr:amidohydrolase family protein [Lewinellaceae bacterium]
MKIDTHQHFWHFNPVRDAWITEDMQAIRRDFLPGDLEPLLKAAGYDGSIAVQADQSDEETAFLLDLAEQNDFILGVVGWVDLQSEDIRERLDKLASNPLLKGIRHIVQAEPEDFMLRPDFQRGISYLREFGLTYDILVYPNQLPAAIGLALKFPEQRFVLDHIAKPNIKADRIEPWGDHIRTLASASSNVYCKLSGMVTEADWGNWDHWDFNPYLDVVYEAFGPERLMIGSDWPVCLLSGEYPRVMDIVESYLETYSEEVKDRVLGENAKLFYQL